MKKKLLLLVSAVLILSMMLSACGNSSESNTVPADPSSAQPMRLVESGFSVISDAEGYGVNCALILENPNAGLACRFPGYTVTVKDAAGNVLKSEDYNLMTIGALEKVGKSNNLTSLSAEPASVEITVNEAEGTWEQAEPAENGLSVENLVLEDGFIWNLKGTIVNSSKEKYDEVNGTVIYRDDSGKIVGGISFYVTNVGKGKTDFEEIVAYHDFVTDNYDVYVCSHM